MSSDDETPSLSLLGYPDGTNGGLDNVLDLFKDFGRKEADL